MPWKPAWHMHSPRKQMPCMLHPFGQLPSLAALPGGILSANICFVQFEPVHPGLQKQRPWKHVPCWEQPAGHGTTRSHASPIQPGLQKHSPEWHSPFPLQFPPPGHCTAAFSEQSFPPNPGSQKHLPTWHRPCPEHPFGQTSFPRTTTSQAAPPYPGSQVHSPFTHRPRSMHSGVPGQGSRRSQNSPEKPGLQKHFLLKHKPCRLQSWGHLCA